MMTMKESYSNHNHGSGNHYSGHDERPRYQERDKSRHRGSQHGSQHDLQSSGRYHPGGGHEARHGGQDRDGGHVEREEVFENRIYVGGVPGWMEERELNDYFSKYGEVEKATVIDRSNGEQINRYGFVTFTSASLDSVKKLLNEVDPQELTVTGGRTLTVGPARQKHWSNNYGGPRGGWHNHGDHGGHFQHRHPGYQGGRRHFHPSSTWHRRGDRPHQEGGPRRPREERAAPAPVTDKEESKEGGRVEQVPPQQGFPVPDPTMQNHIAFGSDLVPPSMIIPQHPGAAPFYPGYELPGAGGMVYPGGPFIAPAASMAPSHPGHANNMGYMEYYDQQTQQMMMAMQQAAPGYYGQNYGAGGMYYPVFYPPHPGQPQYYSQPPVYPQYPPQNMEMMSDSGYHDITASSSVLYQDNSVHHQMTMENGQGQEPPAQEVEASPILNMSSLINTQELVQEQGGQETGHQQQQQAPAPMFAPGAGRCFNTPNKSFAQFRGGSHLDPLGNKYPFRGPKGARKFSSSSQHEEVNGGGFMNHEVARDAIIQPPLNNNDRLDAFKHESNMAKRIENQPDILQDSLKQLTIQ